MDLYQSIKSGKFKVTRKAPATIRFWRDIDKDGPEHPVHGKCWIWKMGPKSEKCPYGYISVKHRGVRVHRFSWEMHHGQIPSGMQVLHKCDNPLCVNPSHLFLGTQKDNQQDMVQKGRENRGEGRPQSKLTEEAVLEIRRDCKPGRKGKNVKYFAEKYGVSGTAIKYALAGRNWRYLSEDCSCRKMVR